ncbi:MAG: aminotransferase class V-fold PLP-dependent enzyme [Nitrospirales bacterium]|nr:aminotransferase class V-fold PLP-dependent enzyme [Nitrospirales bacterium]
MRYLNSAALCAPHPDAEREVASTLREFQQYLYSEAGIRWYVEKAQTCREHVARLLHVSDPSRIAFVPNASTANHLVLASLPWTTDDHVITCTHENPSILRSLQALTARGVHLHTVAPTSSETLMRDIEQLLALHTIKAIVLSHVSHVDGRIFPILEIGELAHAHDVLFIVDGAQAVGHIPVDLRQWTGDIYFFTGHKWCQGPLGTGALVMHEHFLQLHPTFGMEWLEQAKPRAAAFEIGTHNIGLIAGLAKACEIKYAEGLPSPHLVKLREQAMSQLTQHPALSIQEWEGPHAPGILTFQCRQPNTHQALISEASRWMIVFKIFTDYPEGETPLIRLSWAGKTSESDLAFALKKIQACLSRA